MNFQNKNFEYTTWTFSEFIDAAFSEASDRQLYLRSLSLTPTKRPTSITADFPEIAGDFVLPPQLDIVAQQLFSSPIRISSAKVGLW
jgi:tRNA wybutosine-synthesizing protein 4